MKRVFVLAILFVLPITAQSATIYVPDDHNSIQAAIDASIDGDMVIVRPGTYLENINFNGKAITLQSEQGPELTVIDGGGSGIVVKFNSGEGQDSIFDGFTVQGGGAPGYGGGVSLTSVSSPVISNNIITGNTAVSGGGGIACRIGSSPMILNNTITNNTAEYGGGILCFIDASPDIYGNTITGNKATEDGGGYFCQRGCFSVLSGNTLANNDATGNGGGIACYEDSSPHFCGNAIDGNTADVLGGGIYFNNSSPLITGNMISNNSAVTAAGGIRGYQSTSTIINNTVSGNTSEGHGGGISVQGDQEVEEIFPGLIVGNLITGNVCFTGGGGVHLGNSSAEFRNNVVTGNTATTRYGGGIVITSYTDVLVANCTIAENSATLGGGAIGALLGAKVNVIDTILWGNSAPTGKTLALATESSLGISFSDVDGGEAMVDVEAGSTLDWGAGNIDLDPLFETGSDGDYYLSAASPCIDAGDENSTMIGGTTGVDQAMDAGIIDMGYHYPGIARLLVGPGPAETNPPLVRLFKPECMADATDQFTAYGASSYGVNVSCGDVDGDLHDEILTGAGPGAIYGPHVRGFNGDGSIMAGLSFLAYGTHKYGVNLATGDLDADGMDEILTGAGPGAVFGPHVRGWNYDGGPGVTPLPGLSYFAYGTPKWGVNVSAGDLDGDGFDEIVTGPGPGAVYGPHVRGWNYDGGPGVSPIPGVSFLAYNTNKFGVNVACGDIDGDGIDEIVTGAGPGAVFGAHVRGWNVDGGAATAMADFSFFAWPPYDLRYGANVFSGADLNGNGRDEIVVGQGPDPAAGSWVKVYMYDGTQAIEWVSLEAFGDQGMTHGANVAAGHF